MTLKRCILVLACLITMSGGGNAQDFRFSEGWRLEGEGALDRNGISLRASLLQGFTGNVEVVASTGLEGDFLSGVTSFGIDEAYVSGALSQYLVWFVGRRRMAWGPESGSLLLSGNAPAYGVLGYELRFPGTRYVRFYGSLGTEERRLLLGHRLDFEPVPKVRLGISEAGIARGDFSPLMLNPLPFWPFALSEHIAETQIPGHKELVNLALGFDMRCELDGRGFLFGEYLLDNWPQRAGQEGKDSNSYRFGGTYIIYPEEGVSVSGQYVKTGIHADKHSSSETEWSFRDEPLGSLLGSNTELLNVSLRIKMEKNTWLDWAWTTTQKGTEVPSLLPERVDRVGIVWGRNYDTGWNALIEVFQEWVSNPGHITGQSSGAGFATKVAFELGN